MRDPSLMDANHSSGDDWCPGVLDAETLSPGLPYRMQILISFGHPNSRIEPTRPQEAPVPYLFALRAICWWTLGHGFAYGDDAGGFVGVRGFAFVKKSFDGDQQGFALAQWFFQWAFAGENVSMHHNYLRSSMQASSCSPDVPRVMGCRCCTQCLFGRM